MKTRAGTFVAGVLILTWMGIPASPARAAACAPGDGTTVVVDFSALGGGVTVGCAPTADTGLEALDEAGFDVVRVQQSPSFVCRIDGLPNADEEDCVDVPPGSAYWSYWTADLGGDWKVSQLGAASSIQGDLDGWSFARDTAVSPDYPIPPPPTTTTTTTTTPPPTTSTTTTSSSTSTTTTTTTSPPTTTLPTTTIQPVTTMMSPTTTSTSTTPTTSPSTTTLPTTSTSPPTSLLAAGADSGDQGGPAGLLVGGGAVALLAAVGTVVARRRGIGS